MNPKIRTQDVARHLYINYLRKSEECFRAGDESFSKGDWNAASICAVHSCIAASDAVCIYFLGKRHSGQNHADAVALLGTIKSGDEAAKNNANRLRKILAIKNMAEYEERLMRRSDAEKVMKDAERFLAFAISQLPEE
jgi:HEPN domain-containing protein